MRQYLLDRRGVPDASLTDGPGPPAPTRRVVSEPRPGQGGGQEEKQRHADQRGQAQAVQVISPPVEDRSRRDYAYRRGPVFGKQTGQPAAPARRRAALPEENERGREGQGQPGEGRHYGDQGDQGQHGREAFKEGGERLRRLVAQAGEETVPEGRRALICPVVRHHRSPLPPARTPDRSARK
ncbi:hypothetical protein [Neomoorella mulderi]|uniref:hypothetical protein n=1 Tax=Neomoorella mulderi TaxID=202604 RepID=UPI00191BE19B|nr:hypothetical protein [Moorella mulderi]